MPCHPQERHQLRRNQGSHRSMNADCTRSVTASQFGQWSPRGRSNAKTIVAAIMRNTNKPPKTVMNSAASDMTRLRNLLSTHRHRLFAKCVARPATTSQHTPHCYRSALSPLWCRLGRRLHSLCGHDALRRRPCQYSTSASRLSAERTFEEREAHRA